jgi:hypothetical protein
LNYPKFTVTGKPGPFLRSNQAENRVGTSLETPTLLTSDRPSGVNSGSGPRIPSLGARATGTNPEGKLQNCNLKPGLRFMFIESDVIGTTQWAPLKKKREKHQRKQKL